MHGARYIVDPLTGCWVWQRSINPQTGYGMLTHRRKVQSAHRWYWQEANGPVPEGLELDHLCRVRACVNPEHLEPVTTAENQRRGLAARRVEGTVLSCEAIVVLIRRWADEHGAPPKRLEWEKATSSNPAQSTVKHYFGTWNAAIAAAGFEPRSRGYQRKAA